MITIVDFEPEHLDGIELPDPEQAKFFAPLLANPAYGLGLKAVGPAFTALVDGVVIACGGVHVTSEVTGPNRAWAFFTAAAGPHMLAITRAVRRWLKITTIRRIEGVSLVDFKASARWHEMLGFEREGLMRSFLPEKDGYLYARIKKL